jgi:DNA-binding transcriptional ArsR family regulator
MTGRASSHLDSAGRAILAELEREFTTMLTFTELRVATGLSQGIVDQALLELRRRRLVDKCRRRDGKNCLMRIYVQEAIPLG